MRPKVLVTKRVYPEAIEYLRERVDVEYIESDESLAPEELLVRLADKDAAITQLTDKCTAEVMDKLPNLKAVSNVAVGFDNIDIDAATARKIAVTNTPDVLTDTTADFAFTLLMAAARRLVEADKFLRAGRWKQWAIDLLCGQDIHHATLGILGMGRIGQTLARRGRGFEMRVLYSRRRPSQTGGRAETGAGVRTHGNGLARVGLCQRARAAAADDARPDRRATTAADEEDRHSDQHIPRTCRR